MYELVSKVKRILYKKETINGDYFIKIRGNDNVILTGFIYDLPDSIDNQEIIFYGEWEELTANQEKQFKFSKYQFKDSMKHFFNKTIKIPLKTLNTILKEYSIKDLQEILDTCPNQLLEFKGIGKGTIKKIELNWNIHKFDTEVYNRLMPYGFSSTLITNIREAFGTTERVIKVLDEDPYQLIRVEGVSFNKVDKIVSDMKQLPLSFKSRIIEGIKYTALQNMNNTGNTIVDYYELFTNSKAILNNDGSSSGKKPYTLNELDFISAIDTSVRDDFVEIKDKLTLRTVYNQEIFIYETLSQMSKKKEDSLLVEDINEWLLQKESIGKFKLSEQQKSIIKTANEQYSVFSLSGYAGTGKTMVSKLVMELYNESNKKIHCCALSGVAANRIKLVSKFDSKTMHSLLGFDGIGYSFDMKTKLPYDLIVIDESGMVNTEMFYNLLQAINWDRTKLFIIGDPAQLLPVGLGNVYQDILNLKLIPNIELNKVFRQKDGSIINIVAQHIRKNEFPEEYEKSDSFGFYTNFLPWTSDQELRVEQTINKLVEIATNNRLKKYTEKTLLDLQIIAPTRTSDAGANKLNVILQELFNPNGKFIEVRGIKYKKGDKVIHLKNIAMDIYKDDEKLKKDKVYNGQIGIVIKVDDDGVFVKYPYEEQEVSYDYDLLKENYLGLAYVLTAHKCQGNEFKDVIMTISTVDMNMINANYLYSAMTRAKENLYIIGDLFALKRGLDIRNKRERETILKNIK